MGTQAVLIRKSTGEIIKHADYPQLDMQPIVGLDPDLEWLIKRTPYERPDYDSRIFVIKTTESITTEPHPEWPHLNQYQITFSKVKRSTAEIITEIENAETNANSEVFPFEKQLKVLALGIGILFRRVEGMTLTARETGIKNKCLNIAVNIWKNHDAMTAKVAEINAGTEPEIDAGWTKTPTA